MNEQDAWSLDQLRATYPDVVFSLKPKGKGFAFRAEKGEQGMSGSTNRESAALLAMTLAAPVIAGGDAYQAARE